MASADGRCGSTATASSRAAVAACCSSSCSCSIESAAAPRTDRGGCSSFAGVSVGGVACASSPRRFCLRVSMAVPGGRGGDVARGGIFATAGGTFGALTGNLGGSFESATCWFAPFPQPSSAQTRPAPSPGQGGPRGR